MRRIFNGSLGSRRGAALGSGSSSSMSDSVIGRPAALALLIIHFSVMSFKPRLPLPPPMSECTPRNHTSHAPWSRVGRKDNRRSSSAMA